MPPAHNGAGGPPWYLLVVQRSFQSWCAATFLLAVPGYDVGVRPPFVAPRVASSAGRGRVGGLSLVRAALSARSRVFSGCASDLWSCEIPNSRGWPCASILVVATLPGGLACSTLIGSYLASASRRTSVIWQQTRFPSLPPAIRNRLWESSSAICRLEPALLVYSLSLVQ
jgi:hypothetical protein